MEEVPWWHVYMYSGNRQYHMYIQWWQMYSTLLHTVVIDSTICTYSGSRYTVRWCFILRTVVIDSTLVLHTTTYSGNRQCVPWWRVRRLVQTAPLPSARTHLLSAGPPALSAHSSVHTHIHTTNSNCHTDCIHWRKLESHPMRLRVSCIYTQCYMYVSSTLLWFRVWV